MALQDLKQKKATLDKSIGEVVGWYNHRFCDKDLKGSDFRDVELESCEFVNCNLQDCVFLNDQLPLNISPVNTVKAVSYWVHTRFVAKDQLSEKQEHELDTLADKFSSISDVYTKSHQEMQNPEEDFWKRIEDFVDEAIVTENPLVLPFIVDVAFIAGTTPQPLPERTPFRALDFLADNARLDTSNYTQAAFLELRFLSSLSNDDMQDPDEGVLTRAEKTLKQFKAIDEQNCLSYFNVLQFTVPSYSKRLNRYVGADFPNTFGTDKSVSRCIREGNIRRPEKGSLLAGRLLSRNVLELHIKGEKRKAAAEMKRLAKVAALFNIEVNSLGSFIYHITGKDATNGLDATYMVLVDYGKVDDFKAAIGSDTMNLLDYGIIIASCYGKEPNDNVRTILLEEYGIDYKDDSDKESS